MTAPTPKSTNAMLTQADLPALGIDLYPVDLLKFRGFETEMNDAMWVGDFSRSLTTTSFASHQTLRIELLIQLVADHLVQRMPLFLASRIVVDIFNRNNKVRIRPIDRADESDLRAKLEGLDPVHVTGSDIVAVCDDIAPCRSMAWWSLYNATIPAIDAHMRRKNGYASIFAARAEYLAPLRAYIDSLDSRHHTGELEEAASIISRSSAGPLPFYTTEFAQYMNSIMRCVRTNQRN